MEPGSTVLGKPGQKLATSRFPPAQLQFVPTTVTRGSDFTTQLSSSSGAAGRKVPGPGPEICGANCSPKGWPKLGGMKALMRTEPELITATPCGTFLPVV